MTDRKRILIIDDDAGVRETIGENLAACGFDIEEAADGEQGLKLIRADSPPHIIITDIIMPRQEGLETIMKIRKAYPAIKVIAISGGGRTKSMDFLALAKKMGADSTLSKPLDMDELERVVRALAG